MLEVVAFDFDGALLFYRDGKLTDERAAYQYDYNDERTFAPFLPAIRAMAPDAPIYHLTRDVFMRAVERLSTWNYIFVLELAREHGKRV